MNFVDHIAQTIDREKLFVGSKRAIVALSGGADSVALLRAMLCLGYEVVAAHRNCGLRGNESLRDERFVDDLCAKLGVELHCQHFNTSETAQRRHVSIEMQARHERYEFFEAIAEKLGIDSVAVAHHRDDNNETILLNLARGTGLVGLRGMDYRNGRIVRPMLDMARKDILDYLRAIGQDFVEDGTNCDTRFKRNLVRHELLPMLRRLNPSIDDTLQHTAQHLREQVKIYEQGVKTMAANCMTKRDNGFDISLSMLNNSGASETLLHEWLSPIGFSPDTVARIATSRTGSLYASADYMATRTAQTIEVRRKPSFVGLKALHLGANKLPNGLTIHVEAETEHIDPASLKHMPRSVAYIDVEKLGINLCADIDVAASLCVRSLQEADRFTPLGMRGSMLVSNYLTNRHRSRIDKLEALVVLAGEKIAWLVGETIDTRAAVDSESKRIIKLRIE